MDRMVKKDYKKVNSRVNTNLKNIQHKLIKIGGEKNAFD